MLSFHSIIALFQPSSIPVIDPVLEVGAFVWVNTLCYGLQLGEVTAIVENPYYGQTGQAAYVCGNGWSEYLPLEVE